MWNLLRSIFFLLDAEKAHYLSMDLFSFAIRIPILSFLLKKSFETKKGNSDILIDGLHYKNRIGLAAGFDKDGRWLKLLTHLGFGFIEVGTVTPLPQSGNDKPRLFRLKKDEGIINRMGFNNEGVDALVERLKKFNKTKKIIIGGNIGKNKNTTQENAIQDYVICFEKLFDYVDYFVVNVSSPNTPNLRALQDKEPLSQLLETLQKINHSKPHPKPIYLKIAPDLTTDALQDIIDVVVNTKIQGIVANNTSISRPKSLIEQEICRQQGGLSGAPICEISRKMLSTIMTKKSFTIINVGGIMDEEEAEMRLQMGADLIQIYSGFIYRGPWFVKRILEHQ